MSGVCVDHLVVAAATLEEGVRWCEATLGVTPGPGGRHDLMGTHNRLFSVAGEGFANAYFEIIAIDPEAAPPGRARWFGLDRLDLSAGPRLVHWVARTRSLDAQLAALRELGVDGGRALAAHRDTPAGRLNWRIAVRDDGAPPEGGAVPALIEWGERHPAASMPASGVTLRSLVLRGLTQPVAQALELLSVRVETGDGPALTVRLESPRGEVTLQTN